MMKEISITIITLLLFVQFVNAGNKEKKNKVKSKTQYAVIYEKGKQTEYKESYEEFARNGKTTLRIEYNPDGSILVKESSNFDSYGNVTEEISIDNEKNKYSRIIYKYNSDNKKSEEIEYNKAGNIIKKTVYSYNSNGDRTVEVVFDGNGNLLKKIVNSYNNKGMRIERKSYNAADAIESVKKTDYLLY